MKKAFFLFVILLISLHSKAEYCGFEVKTSLPPEKCNKIYHEVLEDFLTGKHLAYRLDAGSLLVEEVWKLIQEQTDNNRKEKEISSEKMMKEMRKTDAVSMHYFIVWDGLTQQFGLSHLGFGLEKMSDEPLFWFKAEDVRLSFKNPETALIYNRLIQRKFEGILRNHWNAENTTEFMAEPVFSRKLPFSVWKDSPDFPKERLVSYWVANVEAGYLPARYPGRAKNSGNLKQFYGMDFYGPEFEYSQLYFLTAVRMDTFAVLATGNTVFTDSLSGWMNEGYALHFQLELEIGLRTRAGNWFFVPWRKLENFSLWAYTGQMEAILRKEFGLKTLDTYGFWRDGK